MNVEGIAEVKAAVFEATMKKVEGLISADSVDAMLVEAEIQLMRMKYTELIKATDKLMEKIIADGDSDKLLALEEKRGDYFRDVQLLELRSAKMVTPDSTTVAVPQKKSDHRANLPQRKLQQFSGDVRDWLAFWSSFEDIDQDGDISDADKFQFLLECVPESSSARKCIEGFTVSAKNYRAAVDTLKNLYGREKMLIKVFVRDLLQLVIKNATEGSSLDFMDLYPKLSSHIRNLGELGVTTDKCEEILYPVVESCLPDDILLAWQRHPNYDEKLEDMMNFLNVEVHNKMDRSLAKMQFSLSTESSAATRNKYSKKDKEQQVPTAAGFMATYVPPPKGKGKRQGKDKQPCGFCGDTRHKSEKCGRAKTQMTMEERIAALKERKCCFRCLLPGHSAKTCRQFVRCCICMGEHYEVICRGKKDNGERGAMMAVTQHTRQNSDNFETASNYGNGHNTDMGYHHQQPPQPPPSSSYGFGQPQQQSHGISHNESGSKSSSRIGMSNVTSGKGRATLKTFIAIMETPRGRWRVRIFVDEGSEESYVDHRCAVDTGCVHVGTQTMSHQLFGAVETGPVHHPQYKVKLVSMDRAHQKEFIFNSIPKIANGIRKPIPGKWIDQLAEKGIVFTDQTDSTEEVQFLMGIDTAAQIWTGGFYRVDPYLYARESIFGWILGGLQTSQNMKVTRTNMVTTMMITNTNVEELWSLEALGITEESRSQTKQDLEEATTEYFKQTVQRNESGRYIVQLPWKEGHRTLTGNFNQVFSRLKNTTNDLQRQGYWDAYDKIFRDWERDGIIQEVRFENEAALKTLYLLPHRHVVKENSSTTPVRPVFDASAKGGKGGPSLNECQEKGPNLLFLIPAIMCGFRKFKVGAVSDVKKAFLQIELAKEDQEMLNFLWWKDSSCRQLKLYRHLRVVFGLKPSPFLLAATLKYHVEWHGRNTPELAEKLLQSLYVDNSCSSHISMHDALTFQEGAQRLLLPAHFDLRGWEFSYSEDEKSIPVLGMTWETKSDTISLCLDSPERRMDGPLTKRGLLSMVNSVFDPLGYACAVTVLPKLLLQECCNLKLNWDDPLPDDISSKLQKWRSQVPVLKNMKIPRWIGLSNSLDGVSIHCCSDASGVAFATYIFVRRENGGHISVQLVMGKSRVAPAKKKVTIPRLELLGCEIGALLTVNSVVKFLDLENVPRYFWTDSTAALAWIQREKEWARFVANRVAVIRKLTKPEEWHHVPGELNPADIPSRGCTASRLVESRFWEGPDWLRKPQQFWPNSTANVNEEVVNMEKKKSVVAAHSSSKKTILSYLSRFSDFHRILRIVACILRYADILKNNVNRKKNLLEEKSSTPAEYISRAESCILRWIQKESFKGVDDSRLLGMGAFVDTLGLIRIKSQLLFGTDEFGMRCPVVLPHEHLIVKKLIQKEHELHSHAGVQIMQSVLRNRFWIMRSRRTISGVVNSCTRCKRFTAKRCEVPSAPLPANRIRNTVAFDVTGVDLAGPLTLRGGHKVWIVLFTCGVYRAVHLELVTTLSTRGFVMAFQRFVARRGRPSTVYSDNGLNFVGCNNAFKKIDWDEVQRLAAVERIDWRFNPPTAAWWGGWWERLVGLTKQLLRRVLGKKAVEYEELLTILCDVEGNLNQRPLTYVADQKDDLLPLCPAHFMRDNPRSNLPEGELVEAKDLRNSVQVVQKLREGLRTRFRKEYLGQLQHRAGTKTKTVQIGDVVIVEDENRKRLEWQLGVIKQVYPGRDGAIRTALVKTTDGEFLRPVQRLFIMEMSEDIEKESTQEGAVSSLDSKAENVSRFGRQIKKPDRFGLA